MKKGKFRGLRDDQLLAILQQHEGVINAQTHVINTQGAILKGMSEAVSKLIARTGMSVEQFMQTSVVERVGESGLVLP